jgi:hypothetical protein
MQRACWRLGLVVLLVPALAHGAEATRTVLDFTRPGPLKTYFELAMAVARSYLPLALILAVLFEALGRAPGTPRNFAAVAWRFIVIAFLLVNYQRVFGFVIETTSDIADRLSPADALQEFHKYLDAVYEPQDPGAGAGTMGAAGTADVTAGSAARPSRWSFSGIAFDGTMGVLLFLAKALVYGLERLARILTAVFFILGPLALVAGIPRVSNTAFSWFRHFVTMASWPIFSGVLLGVMAAVAKQSVATGAGTYLGNLVAAVVMAFCALAAPVLSGWIIGGATQNVAALGQSSFENTSRKLSSSLDHLKKMTTDRSRRRGSGSDEERGKRNGSGPDSAAGGRGAVTANPPLRGPSS